MFPREGLRREYTAYAEFHRHPTNARIHFVGVPLLHVTALILVALYLHKSAPVICACLYCIYYFLLDAEAALACLPYQVTVTALSYLVVARGGSESAVAFHAASLHLLSWVAQIYGHRVYEGNSPALPQSFVGSVLTAPLFVVLEMLWLAGYALNVKAKLDPVGTKQEQEARHR